LKQGHDQNSNTDVKKRKKSNGFRNQNHNKSEIGFSLVNQENLGASHTSRINL
jgi:hypothetical protein